MTIVGGLVSIAAGTTSAVIGATTDKTGLAVVTAGFSAASGVVAVLGGVGEPTEMHVELYNARIVHWNQAMLMLSMYPEDAQRSGSEMHGYVIQLLNQCSSSSPGPVPAMPDVEKADDENVIDEAEASQDNPPLFDGCTEEAPCAPPAQCINGQCVIPFGGERQLAPPKNQR